MKLIFVVGTGRCGSTFINNLISMHEDTGFISDWEDRHINYGILGSYNGKIYRSKSSLIPSKLKKRFAPSEAYRLLSREASAIFESPCRDLLASDVTPWLREHFTNFFEYYNQKQGREVFIHKYTGWSRIRFLAEIFPDAKFINIIRDGRAVANSWLQMPWWGGYDGPENWLWGLLPEIYYREWLDSNKSYVVLAGIGWKLLMESYESSVIDLNSSRYHEVKYEEFISRPEAMTKDILEFAELEWTANFDEHFNLQKIRTSRKRAFEKDLNCDQLQELENCLSDTLIKYKYM